MKRSIFALIAAAFALWAGPAAAQSGCSYIVTGAVLTAAQWQSCFQAKTDNLGYTPLNISGGTMAGPLGIAASTTSSAGLILQVGVAPTSPVDGSLWTTTTGLFARINGTTVGPFTGPVSGSFAATSPLSVSFPAGVVTYAISPTPTFGVAGSVLGTISLANLTSGTITLRAVAGALGSSALTLPAVTDTVAVLAASQALINKTYNGLTITSSTGTLAIANTKTMTVNNSLALSGTDGTTFIFPGSSDTIVTLAAAQTLTNKSIAATQLTGTLQAGQFPALTGDVTTSAGSLATTLATVATAGTTGSSTAIPVITINAKGLTTSITTAAVVAPAGTLTGSTLASGVTTSSLTSVGTIGTGVWQGSVIAATYLATGTNSALGVVKCDGTTTSCAGGVITAVGASAGSITVGTTTIGSGTPNGLLYDAAGVLGNLATANSGVLITSGAGVPSISTTLPSALTIPSPTFSGTVRFASFGVGAARFDASGNVSSIPDGVFNIVTYGASTGASAATNKTAIDATIAAASVAGGIVYTPAGTFNTDGNHVISSFGVTLMGAGPNASVWQMSATNVPLLTVTKPFNMTGMRFSGNATCQWGILYQVDNTGAYPSLINNNSFQSFNKPGYGAITTSKSGAAVGYPGYLTITDNVFASNDYIWVHTGGDNIRFMRNWAGSNGITDANIFIKDQTNTTEGIFISDNTIFTGQSTAQGGIYVLATTTSMTGIYIERNIIGGSVFNSGLNDYGPNIRVQQASTGITDLKVNGNYTDGDIEILAINGVFEVNSNTTLGLNPGSGGARMLIDSTGGNAFGVVSKNKFAGGTYPGGLPQFQLTNNLGNVIVEDLLMSGAGGGIYSAGNGSGHALFKDVIFAGSSTGTFTGLTIVGLRGVGSPILNTYFSAGTW